MPPLPDGTFSRRASPSSTREILLVVSLLAALFVLSHTRALPPGNVLCAADAVLQGSPFSSETSPEGKRGRNEALWDQALQFGPWFRLASRELRAGRFPLWNAHAGCGTVLAAND